MFYSLLKDGKKITIKDKCGRLTATTFYLKDDTIFYDNTELGYGCKHDIFTADFTRFEKHIKKMLSDNLTIVIE